MKSTILFFLIFLHRLPIGKMFWRKKRSNRIFILKVDAIGDSIIWLDSAKEYRKAFPNDKLVLCYKKDWEDIALQLPYFDEYIPFDQKLFFKSIKYRISFLRKINQYHYKKAINPTFSRNFFLQDWIMYNLHADEKIGSIGDYNNTNNTIAKLTDRFDYYNPKLKKIADRWYTQLFPASDGTKMELTRNAEFIRAYINSEFRSQIPQLPFALPKSDLIPSQDYVVFFMGASTERRMWDVKNFAMVASQLIEKYLIVVCGSQSEAILYEKLIEYNLDKTKIVNLCGKTNLIELMSIIQSAQFILSNETAASHIAVVTNTPSICLLGGGHYGRFQPYEVENIQEKEREILPKVAYYPMDCFGCGWICKYPLENGKWRCINAIRVDTVNEKIQKIMKIFN